MRNLIFFLPMMLLVACQQQNNQNGSTEKAMTEVPKMSMADPKIMSLFEEVNVVKMHLFGTTEAMPNADNYPYAGKPITGEALGFLSNDLQPNDVGGVYACYHTENSNHFILRVPGKHASSDLVLAMWDGDAKKLVEVMDLAFLMCDEGICHQQDAWLADLDDSRTLELIVRKHTRDMQGNISEESFEVMTDNGTGHFIKTDEQLASLAVMGNYVMQMH